MRKRNKGASTSKAEKFAKDIKVPRCCLLQAPFAHHVSAKCRLNFNQVFIVFVFVACIGFTQLFTKGSEVVERKAGQCVTTEISYRIENQQQNLLVLSVRA